ncbi:hypothetical protein BDZ97DRAFT_1810596 [Flammula alnicola]|nr:hypothetical protein BDZ97DRAFT_1810596 [Flammula alnicola]
MPSTRLYVTAKTTPYSINALESVRYRLRSGSNRRATFNSTFSIVSPRRRRISDASTTAPPMNNQRGIKNTVTNNYPSTVPPIRCSVLGSPANLSLVRSKSFQCITLRAIRGESGSNYGVLFQTPIDTILSRVAIWRMNRTTSVHKSRSTRQSIWHLAVPAL